MKHLIIGSVKKAVFVLCGTCARGGYPTKFIRGDFLQVQTLTFHHNITFLTGKVILSNTDNSDDSAAV